MFVNNQVDLIILRQTTSRLL